MKNRVAYKKVCLIVPEIVTEIFATSPLLSNSYTNMENLPGSRSPLILEELEGVWFIIMFEIGVHFL